MTSPLVSIGVPVRNEERYISETLDLLLAQDYEPIEIVISDNASTDRTEEICRAYAARDRRVVYHRQPVDRGAVFNFNETFRRSTGELFTWASGHDRRDAAAIRACVDALLGEPGAVLAFPSTLEQDASGGLVETNDDRLDTRGRRGATGRVRATIEQLDRCNAIHGVVRADALRRTRLLRPVIGCDNVLLAELAVVGAAFQIPDRLFVRTQNRPPESGAASTARHVGMLGIRGGRRARHPFSAMAWEHVAGMWAVAPRRLDALQLAAVAGASIGKRWWRVLVGEWSPGFLRVAVWAKRRVRRA